MNVGHLTSHVSARSTGVWTSASSMVEAFEHTRDIDVVMFGLADENVPRNAATHIPAHVYKVLGPRAFGYAPNLLRGLLRADLDLLHLHGLWMYPALAARNWGRITGRPQLISTHGMLDAWAIEQSAVRKQLIGACFQGAHLSGADCLHALGEEERVGIRAFGLKNPICVIPNGVAPARGHAERLSTPWDEALTQGKSTLIFLGRLHRKKGVHILIDAVFELATSGRWDSNWRIIIAGWDDSRYGRSLRAKVVAYSLENIVFFVGPLFDERKAAAFACVDGMILPSLSEGQPLAVLEAWSYGLPVIMTRNCNLSQGFDAAAAIRADANTAGVKQALETFFQLDADERAAMGERGRELVRHRYSWPLIAERLGGVYAWLLGEADMPTDVTMD